MRRFLQFLIFFINFMILVYILPIQIIQLHHEYFWLYIFVYYMITRFYIVWETQAFPAKMNKFVDKREIALPLLIPFIGPMYVQFIHTSPVFSPKSKLVDANFDYEKMHFYNNGITFFNELYSQIENAQEEIVLYYYIVKDDDLVEQFTNLLIKKHQQNVKVKIKVDAFGLIDAYKSFYFKLKKNGINIKIVSEYKRWDFSNILSYRSHKKFVIIDNKICYLGGMNLAQEYLGFSSKYGMWEDYMIKYQSSQLATLLLNDFNDTTNKVKYKFNNSRLIIENGDLTTTKIYDKFMQNIEKAQERIIIITPYVSLTKEMFDLLERKAKDVKITFIVPGKTDGKFYASLVLKSTLAKIENIEIREVTNTFVHTKLYYFDKKILFGSTNFDMRSFFINDEILVSTKTNYKFEAELKRLISISKPVKYKKFNSFFDIFKNAM